MRLPYATPSRPLASEPVYAHAEMGGLAPQDWVRGIRCAAACKNRAGFAACVARCVATGEVCDGGIDNCSGL
jgi:hypothetical protein